ncbi:MULTISPECIES: HPP family protein [Pedobacter]|uniref:HPP family protein n=1 Tax=Pedobacter heparinus (strain ATCC 13125 / DSM 2366 / CIP 104194 / JCM 7457 / NBRC 12017 / NCIMB 9290 / NRRL B-14731 / HIM 762-3) TaxID=485917 RepID=C6Y1H6_PEDHD|nr:MULTISPECIES: HPP family protein [Pedobacter]ACU02952.1 HPP family protein [Pedobacter heparinus DSM 2366]MBB5440682.1 CBS-domain-containing membrane protein [Pedobacter sp. AK017]
MPGRIIKKQYRKARYILYRETLIDAKEHVLTFLGSFVGIGLIGLLNSQYLVASDNLFLIGSFGASSVLVYGLINSPLAQPRNLIGGHVICAIIGVTVFKLFSAELWFACALAVSLSIVAMQITKTLHPPGGATALIAVTGGEKIRALGYMYVLSPVLSGVLILFLVALIFNNLRHRKYPSKPILKRRKAPRFAR